MSLNLPSRTEVRLGNPPLEEVICQVKFSPILRIQNETPSEFQESIRERFPGLEVEQGILVQLPNSAGIEKPSLRAETKTYRFSTMDGKTFVSLAADFLAVDTKAYNHWNEFTQDLRLAFNAVEKVYHPNLATRLGLRFINRFTRKTTELTTNEELLSLFRPELTCLIRTDAWRTPSDLLSQIILNDKKAKLAIRIRYGKEKNEPFLVLDFDYFEEGHISLDNSMKSLDHYHTRLYDAFRWCLLDESLKIFSPIDLEN